MNSSTAALAFTPGSPFLLGVNYWPSEAAMSMWEADHDDLYRRDLDQMARLGLQVVRIFLLWGAL